MVSPTAPPISAPTSAAASAQANAVSIGGALVTNALVLDANEIGRLPQASIDATDHDGARHHFVGIRLADALHAAGVPTGAEVRGPAASAYVLITATDGYTTLFSLGEIDPTQPTCDTLIANGEDGQALPVEDGSLRLIAPCDRTHARWIHGISNITVVLTRDSTKSMKHETSR